MEELRKILTGDILPESGEILLNGKQTEIPGNGRIAVIQERTTKTMIFPKLDYMNKSLYLSGRKSSFNLAQQTSSEKYSE